MTRIGVSRLAEIPSGATRIYEDRPVVSALPLPAYEDLLSEYASAAQDLTNGAIPEGVNWDARSLLSRLPSEPSAVRRVRLVCRAFENALMAEVELYDRAGKKLDGAFLFSGPTDGRITPAAFLQEASRRPGSRWSPLSPSVLRVIGDLTGDLTTLSEWFTQPLQREPLDGFVREALNGYLSREKADCLAYDASDGLWGLVRGCVAGDRVSIDALGETLKTWLPMQRVTGPGSVVWRPVDPEADEARRVKRGVLQTFAKASLKNGSDLRETCRLFHDASQEVGPLAETWWATDLRLHPPTSQALLPEVYAFLGSVSDARWRSLENGRPMSVAQLGIEVPLEKLLSRESGTTVVGPDPISDIEGHPMENFWQTALKDATLCLQTRAQPLIAIEGQGERRMYWSPRGAPNGRLALSFFDFQNVEGQITTRMNRELYEARFNDLRFRNGSRDDFFIVLGLPGQKSIQWVLPGVPKATSPPFGYADLPDEVRRRNWENAYAEGMAAARRSSIPP